MERTVIASRSEENVHSQEERKASDENDNSEARSFETIELQDFSFKYLKKPEFLSVEDTFQPYIRLKTMGSTFYEVIKTSVTCVTLLPIRAIFLLIFILLYALVAKLATICLKKNETAPFQPLSKWRAMFMMLFKPMTRALLFIVFGVYHIKRKKLGWKDLPQIPEQNPPFQSSFDKPFVVVANHLGYLDILVLLATHGGAFVAKGAIAQTPIVGTVANALQTLYVRKGMGLTKAIIDRVSFTYDCHSNADHEYHHDKGACGSCLSTLTIFPEGTTTNGSAMVKFRTGVFNAAKPVLPIAIKFPHKHFNLSWETITFKAHLFRTMTQIVNHVEVAELPFYHPSEREQNDSRLYSENVQCLLAAALEQQIYPLNRKQKFLYHSYVLGKKNEQEALAEASQLYEEDKLLQVSESL